ncbi:MAG: phosphatidylserine decarboxylase family protein [Deltaproteobacteria bacterium]|nr:phosphatidylserine decarboxylase family protein [Deltaproteobacteria bacterium]
MSIAREGFPLIAAALALALVAFLLGWWIAAWGFALLALAITGFFRDPERVIPSTKGVIVSPADGKVVSIAAVDSDPLFTEAATRVSIFLSPVDVHINRVPAAGRIEAVKYQSGKFLAAYKAEASRQNEQNAVMLSTEQGQQLGVVQIAGWLARRIVCHAKQGERYAQGDRFGLIMFGSRTDTYLPKGCKVEVVEGQRVKGGETVLGRFV